MDKKNIATFELFMIVLAVFSFAYIASETNHYFNDYSGLTGENELVENLRNFIALWMERSKLGIASAQTISLQTCLEDVNGSYCQEYSSEECNDLCNDACFPGRRDEFSQCRLGTCLDPTEGTCSPNTPFSLCENAGGNWFEQTPAQCNPGCCIIGADTQYVTENTCNVLSSRVGVETEWQPVSNEIECLLLADQQETGACVLSPENEGEPNNCLFNTKAECLSMGGDFSPGFLCSHPELNTVCQKQQSVACSEGEDEVYWFDSCGNKENIYDSNKVRSWNNGEVLSESESCSLESGNNPLGNQRRCGNCEYLLGSVCGVPGEIDESIIDSELGNFVCKDLSCTDSLGNHRKNGESWCEFDSQIGLDNEDKANDERAVDVPGSRHYRQICFDGEVRTEECADFRGEVCIENRDESVEFSSAACRINQWQQCIAANTDKIKLDKCEEHTDCSLHRVDIDKFEFDVCTPKYPPGFNLNTQNGGEVGESICSLASQTCTVVETKRLTGGWRCRQNCDCKSAEFTESMNNLCISLGDCGGHVNLEGEFSDDGYKVFRAPNLGSGYINELKSYAEAEEGQFVEPLTGKELSSLFGVPESTFENSAEFGEFVGKLGLGGTGVLLAYGAYKLGSVSQLFSVIKSGSGLSSGGVNLFPWQTSAGPPPVASGGIGSFANAAGGAAAGASIAYMIGKLVGLQGEALDLLTIAGGITGFFSALNFGNVFSTSWFTTVIIVVIVVAIILNLLGVGKVRTRQVTFSCLPWQPPSGGADCASCGENGLPCSEYKCNSLGKSCEFINEGTFQEACIDVSPNDASAPIISPNEEALGESYEYTGVSGNGFKIESAENDGCVQEYQPIPFGISLNEVGQCKIETEHTSSYEEMSSFFDNSNLYKLDHEMILVVPDLASLGVTGINPDRRGSYDLFVRCQDFSGNSNVAEYNINLCVAPANDLTPPLITEFIPETGYVSLNSVEKNIQFFTNEPAECRWSLSDEDFEQMDNVASCNLEFDQVTVNGWMCNSVLPVTNEEETDYYFRCKDKPYVLNDDDDSNDEERNTNTESFVYTLIKTTEELKINVVEPEQGERIVGGSEPVSVDLVIQTQGGVDDNALCGFSFDESGESGFVDFFDSGSNIHKQSFSTLFEGNYDLSLECRDAAENVASASIEFEIDVDSIGPEISAVYNLGGSLNVITNEEAECAYDFDSCSFSFEEGLVMSGANRVHTTSFDQGKTYRIKCQDTFGNIGPCLSVSGGY